MLDVGLVASGHLPTLLDVQGPEVGWAVIDTDFVYRAINDALARQNGRPAQEHIGRTVDEMLPASAAALKEVLHEALENRAPVVDRGLTWIDAAGVEREGVVTYTPDFRVSDGGHVGWTALVRPLGSVVGDGDRTVHAIRRLRSEIAHFRSRAGGGAAEVRGDHTPDREGLLR